MARYGIWLAVITHILLHDRRFQATVITGVIGTYALVSVIKNNQARPVRRAVAWYNVRGEVHGMKVLHRGRRALEAGRTPDPGMAPGGYQWVETAMLKLLYMPVAIVAGIVGGVLSGLIFKRVWKVVGQGSDAPAPMDSERGWGEICWSSMGDTLVKAAVDRGAAEWTRKASGIWPGGTPQQPGKSPDHHEAKAAVRTAG